MSKKNKENPIRVSMRLLTLMESNYGHVWLLPDEQSCLIYALTEGIEAVEAQLRTKTRPNDSRNNAKEFDYDQELADTAMMLLRFIQARHPEKPEDHLTINSNERGEKIYEYLDSTEVFGVITIISGMLNSYLHDNNSNNYEMSVYSYDPDIHIAEESEGNIWVEVFNSDENEQLALYIVGWINKYLKRVKDATVDQLISKKLNKIANRIDRKEQDEATEQQ